jgi:hypothetical protein
MRSVTSMSSIRSWVCTVSVSPRTTTPVPAAEVAPGVASVVFTAELFVISTLDLTALRRRTGLARGSPAAEPPQDPHAILAEQLTSSRRHRIAGSARRSREVGEKPTRCRHCKREVASHSRSRNRQPLCERMGRPGMSRVLRSTEATIRKPGYLTPGRPFPPPPGGDGARTRREGVPCEFVSFSLRSFLRPSLLCPRSRRQRAGA